MQHLLCIGALMAPVAGAFLTAFFLGTSTALIAMSQINISGLHFPVIQSVLT